MAVQELTQLEELGYVQLDGFMQRDLLEGLLHRTEELFEQEGEKIVGVLAFFFGGAAFKPSAFRNKELELHMDTPLANFVLKAEYKANEISGRWSTERIGTLPVPSI